MTDQFVGVLDGIIDYCDRRKLVFMSANNKIMLIIDADRARPSKEDGDVEISDSAWEKSREILKNGKMVKVENPSTNDLAIAHVPLVVRDA